MSHFSTGSARHDVQCSIQKLHHRSIWRSIALPVKTNFRRRRQEVENVSKLLMLSEYCFDLFCMFDKDYYATSM